jgi:hypothetical protein
MIARDLEGMPGPARAIVPLALRLFLGLAMSCLASAAQAQARADFSGKTVTIISSFGPGGGYTIYAQLRAISARICRAGLRSSCATCRAPAD